MTRWGRRTALDAALRKFVAEEHEDDGSVDGLRAGQAWRRSGELADRPAIAALRRQAAAGRPAAFRRTATLRRSGVAAAGIAAAGYAVALVMTPPGGARTARLARTPASAVATLVATGPGRTHAVRLSDGTMVELDGRSSLRLAYSGSERRVFLDRGRALFAVAHNAARPFVVVAADGETIDYGTRFVIDRQGDRVLVSLVEGRIAIRNARRPAAPLLLAPGEQAVYLGGGTAALVEAPRADPLDWMKGTVVLDEVPLTEAATTLSRYSSRPIAVAPGLETRAVSGVFRTEHGANFAANLATALNLRTERMADGSDRLVAP